MTISFSAAQRDGQGSSASRRLRRAGQVPGVIYGADKAAEAIQLDHNDLYHALRNEAFHSSVIALNVAGTVQAVVLRDAQWHPYKQLVLHIDFQRVDPNQKLHLKVPLHFVNADIAPGVKLGGGIISHVINEVEVSCLPADLPKFIEVDLKDLDLGHSLHVSALSLPAGVSIVHHGEGDGVVAVVMQTRGAVESEASA